MVAVNRMHFAYYLFADMHAPIDEERRPGGGLCLTDSTEAGTPRAKPVNTVNIRL